MASITFTVGEDGETSLSIQGVKGEACKPIHAAISDDLSKILDIGEAVVTDTPEFKERPLRVTSVGTTRAR